MNDRNIKRKEKLETLDSFNMKEASIVLKIDKDIYKRYKDIVKIKYDYTIGKHLSNYITAFVEDHDKKNN